jgi:hypothetical protein
MGWEQSFLQNATNTCTNPSGQIEDCPLFNIQTADQYSNCNITESNIPAPLAKENVVGGVTTLPGNPPIVSTGYASGATVGASGSGSAPSSPISSTPAASKPTLSYQPGSSMASDGQYEPGAIFAAKSSGILSEGNAAASVTIATTSSSSAAVITPASAAQSAVSSQSFFSTEYSTKGQEVLEVLWVEKVATVTTPGRRRHLHKHRRGGL